MKTAVSNVKPVLARGLAARLQPGLRLAHGPVRICMLAGYSALAAACIALDADALALVNRFSAVHVLLGSGVLSLIAYALLGLFTGVAALILSLSELAASGLVLAAATLGMATTEKSPKAEPATAASRKAGVATPEMQVGVYMGRSSSPPSDVKFSAPDGTDMVLEDVVWKTESFKPSPYYGGRGIDWNSSFPSLGLMVDFTHAKATAIRSQTVKHKGTHKGEPLEPTGPFEAIFRKLEFTHGLNFLTLNGVYRAAGFSGRMVPYAGIGLGFMIPHVDVWRANTPKEDKIQEAQLTGAAYQVLAGIEWRVFRNDRRSVFTEYKFSYTNNDVDAKKGSRVKADILAHQVIVGLYFTPWRQPATPVR